MRKISLKLMCLSMGSAFLCLSGCSDKKEASQENRYEDGEEEAEETCLLDDVSSDASGKMVATGAGISVTPVIVDAVKVDMPKNDLKLAEVIDKPSCQLSQEEKVAQ